MLIVLRRGRGRDWVATSYCRRGSHAHRVASVRGSWEQIAGTLSLYRSLLVVDGLSVAQGLLLGLEKCQPEKRSRITRKIIPFLNPFNDFRRDPH